MTTDKDKPPQDGSGGNWRSVGDLTQQILANNPFVYAESKDRRTQACHVLWDALNAESADIWLDMAPVWTRLLSETEIAALVFSCLRALPAEISHHTVEKAFAGTALAGCIPDMESGKFMADVIMQSASTKELKTYFHGSYVRMPARDKQRARRWLNGGGK